MNSLSRLPSLVGRPSGHRAGRRWPADTATWVAVSVLGCMLGNVLHGEDATDSGRQKVPAASHAVRADAVHAAGAQAATTFFVAVDGNDGWSGTLAAPNATKSDGPFATIVAARNAIRRRKTDGSLDKPMTVLIRGGTYFLTKTLVFQPIDGGTKEAPVSYAAYPGETPIVSGGKLIDATWKTYQGKILVCSIADVRNGKWYFRQLAVNGKRQIRSRAPDQGEYLRGKAVSATSFHYRDDQMRRWHNLDDVEVVVFHSWNESRFHVASLNEPARIVQFSDPKARHPIGWSGAGGPNRYYVENTLEGVTRPGEWYLDRHTGKLYYWPTGDMSGTRIVAPVLKQLVRFEGHVAADKYVEYLNLRGLTFCDADWRLPRQGYPDCGDVGDIVAPSAITYQAARHCEFSRNCVKNVGTYAVELTGTGNRIVGNTLHDTGGGGVITRSYGSERNLIANNHIHHCGLVYPSAVGINVDDGGGTIVHNRIHDITHSGIYTRHWATATQAKERRNQQQGLAIEHNEIFNVMLNMHDGAGIFVRDSHISIANNLIHDVYAGGDRCPGWGIYLGCDTRNTVVKNNVVYGTMESVHVWYHDRNVVLENNVFVGARHCQINYQNPPHLAHEKIVFRRNIVYCTEPHGYLFHVSGTRSLPAESDYNVIFSTVGCVLNDPVIKGLPGVQSFAQWRKRGLDAHTLTADPLFVDLQGNDYSLKAKSPALKVGFKPIDLSHVGLTKHHKPPPRG